VGDPVLHEASELVALRGTKTVPRSVGMGSDLDTGVNRHPLRS
jgi:hypothetical protein